MVGKFRPPRRADGSGPPTAPSRGFKKKNTSVSGSQNCSSDANNSGEKKRVVLGGYGSFKKKRKLGMSRGFKAPGTASATSSKSLNSSTNRTNLTNSDTSVAMASSSSNADNVSVYTVLYTKQSRKKRKVYDDGVVRLKGKGRAELYDTTGKLVAKTISMSGCKGFAIEAGSEMFIGNWECEVVKQVDARDYETGRIFLAFTAPAKSSSGKAKKGKSMVTSRARSKFKAVNDGNEVKPKKLPKARHDPNAEDSLVFSRVVSEA